jgi:hypothetical protein
MADTPAHYIISDDAWPTFGEKKQLEVQHGTSGGAQNEAAALPSRSSEDSTASLSLQPVGNLCVPRLIPAPLNTSSITRKAACLSGQVNSTISIFSTIELRLTRGANLGFQLSEVASTLRLAPSRSWHAAYLAGEKEQYSALWTSVCACALPECPLLELCCARATSARCVTPPSACYS